MQKNLILYFGSDFDLEPCQLRDLIHSRLTPNKIIQVSVEALPDNHSFALVKATECVHKVGPHKVIVASSKQGESTFLIERIAVRPENQGSGTMLPAGYFSTLDTREALHRLSSRKIPAQISCDSTSERSNHLYYGLLHYIKQAGYGTQCGLLQFPLFYRKAYVAHQSTCYANEHEERRSIPSTTSDLVAEAMIAMLADTM